MIKLTNLNQVIKTIQGQTIADAFGTGNLTIKKAFIGCCELHRPVKPGSGEVLQVFGLGMKLNSSETECELSSTEFETLENVVDNSQLYVVAIVAQLLQYLKLMKKEEVPEQNKTIEK
jgi:hypothetical protein